MGVDVTTEEEEQRNYVSIVYSTAMFNNLKIPSLNGIGYHQRLSIVIIVLASLAVLLVVTSIVAFVYVTRKGAEKSEEILAEQTTFV